MCKCANKLIHVAFFIAVPILLSACGGAPADDSPNTPSSAVTNKPEVSSNASSLALSSATTSSVSSAVITSSAITTSSASSKVLSSGQSNSRVARVSSSASSQDTPPGFDLLAPEVTQLQLYRLSENDITLVWNDAVDNVGISHYKIARNGTMIASIEYPTNIFYDQNLSAYTDYQYTITAFDLSGNDSGASPTFTVRTLAIPNSSKANSSARNSSSLSSSKSSNLSSNSSSKSATSSISSTASSQKSVKITWTHPNQRENGRFLELDEISGYEIRYRKLTDSRYTYIVINSNEVNEYTHKDAVDTEFEIAVFDTNGVYSRFVKVTE